MKVNFKKPKKYRWYHRWLGLSDPPRKHIVRIDPWDSWDVEYTLSLVALPLLRDYRKRNNGYPFGIEEVDIPGRLEDQDIDEDEKLSQAWSAILDQMIQAHEFVISQEEDDFYDDLFLRDRAAFFEKRAQVEHGLRLFAKYYFNLWW